MPRDDKVRSILVYVGSNPDDAIGENVLKLPFLNVIRTAYPDAKITWIAGIGPAQFQGVLSNVIDGKIAEFLTDFHIDGSITEVLFRWRPLPGRRFDLIFDAQRNIGHSLVLRRIPHRLFISGCWRFFFSDRKPAAELRHPTLLTDKLLGLAAAAMGETIRPDPAWPLSRKWIDRAAEILPAGQTYIGLAPGAGKKGTGKCWPLDRFIALARDQFDKGRIPVFLIGPGEIDWIDDIKHAVPQSIIPSDSPGSVGQREPALAMALARRLHTAVANCSGIGHLLAAGGPPMVSLFGPTRPSKYAPYASKLIALRAQDYGGSGDISNIPLDAVSQAIDQHLGQINGPRTAAQSDGHAQPEQGSR